MNKKIVFSLLLFIVLVILDQIIKYGFVFWHWRYDGSVISLILTYNYGVAFSMFSFLEGNLKYVQLVMLLGVSIYLLFNKELLSYYYIPITMVFAGGISNIIDRFVHGGVVDYIFWHYKFEFAVFNLADVIINLAVAGIIYLHIKELKAEKQK